MAESIFEGSRVAIGMLIVQVIATGLQLLSKIILSHGTFVFALMAYRHIVATLCIAPFAFLWERESMKKVNLSVFFWLFVTSLTGIIMAMGCFYYGLRDTTATYATNFLNLIPVVTFLFSTLLGIEKLQVNTKGGKIKLIGATLCLAGTLTMTLYTGKEFCLSHCSNRHHVARAIHTNNWFRGTIFLVCGCFSYGVWFIIQAKLSRIFPYKYSATFYVCMIATFLSVIVGVSIDRSMASWKLGFNLQLITIFYSGTLATATSLCLMSWVVAKRGPTYPSMFNPLSLIFVAITETVFLGREISVGSLLGMFLIIMGLYLFLWAKSKESTKKISAKSGEVTEQENASLQSINIVTPSLPHERTGMQLTAVVVPASSPIHNEDHN